MIITADRTIELIKAKRQADIDKYIKSFPENPAVQLLNGRWGPYLVIDKNNYKIPKGTAITAATETIKILPNKALAMPPPISPTGLGMFVRKFQLIFDIPVFKTK